MNLTYIASSTVILEKYGHKILMDPWVVDGEYYGSWCHVPAVEIDFDEINSCDYIYISHIHPDHFSRKSLEFINKDIPVLILNYSSKFLKTNIERLGFNVIELNHNEEFTLFDDFKLKIFAADNCNPELCGKFFGCVNVETAFETTQIDSMAIFYCDDKVILNVNDCPFELATATLNLIKSQFKNIDLLLVGYAGAGPYPQCFLMTDEEKIARADEKKLKFLNQGLEYISTILPTFYMPFAGTYTLSGKLSILNKYRGVPDIEDALLYFEEKVKNCKGFLLNMNESFNLDTFEVTSSFRSFRSLKENYVQNNLNNFLMDYEVDSYPTFEEISSLLLESHARFKRKVQEIGLKTTTSLYISISFQLDVKFDAIQGSSFEIVENSEVDLANNFVRISTDYRLLYRLLKGPKYAHWNNAEIGSHLTIQRRPDKFERGLFHCLYFFHS